jgi:hypothetical protein
MAAIGLRRNRRMSDDREIESDRHSPIVDQLKASHRHAVM